jgi:hypothetical protein
MVGMESRPSAKPSIAPKRGRAGGDLRRAPLRPPSKTQYPFRAAEPLRPPGSAPSAPAAIVAADSPAPCQPAGSSQAGARACLTCILRDT